MFVSATPPSVSALALLPKKNCQFPKNSGVLLGVGVLHRHRPNYATTLKKRRVDVVLFVRRPQIAPLDFPEIDIFFDKSVSALTLGGVALKNTNENLLGRIFSEG